MRAGSSARDQKTMEQEGTTNNSARPYRPIFLRVLSLRQYCINARHKQTCGMIAVQGFAKGNPCKQAEPWRPSPHMQLVSKTIFATSRQLQNTSAAVKHNHGIEAPICQGSLHTGTLARYPFFPVGPVRLHMNSNCMSISSSTGSRAGAKYARTALQVPFLRFRSNCQAVSYDQVDFPARRQRGLRLT
jgi:hypothetical protein